MRAAWITILQLVPSMLRMLVAEPGFAACGSSLRRVTCSGEALPPDVCEKFFSVMGYCELVNLYGPTECAIDTAYHHCKPGETVVPIGRPVANTQFYVLNERMQPAPIGITGELYIGGAQLARGYLGQAGVDGGGFCTL